MQQENDSQLKQKTAKGLLWAFMNNGATQLLNAVFGVVLLNILDRADYGMVGILTVFTLVANAIQDSGFVTALINKRNATHLDYNSVFWFNICVSFTLYVILFFCAPLIADFYDEPQLEPLARYYFFGFFIASFSIVPRAILTKQIKQKELAFMGFFALVLSGTVGIVMALNKMTYWGIATQTMVFNLMISVLSWYFSKWKPSRKISLLPIREMFGFSSKMLITNIFNQVNNNVFSIILGKIYTKVEVGTYTQANKWNNMGNSTITGMVQGVAQPTFVQVGDDPERLRRAFSKMLRFTSFVAFPVMFALALVAHEFIMMLARTEWESSAQLMHYLCVGGAFLPIATLYYNLIISRGKSDIYMWNVIAQGSAILGTILMVHAAGGGVDAMIISYVCVVVIWIGIWHIFLYQEIRYPFLSALKDMLPFLLTAAATMTIVYFITAPFCDFQPSRMSYAILLLVRVLLAAAIYLGILWLFGAKILKECFGYLLKKKK